MSEVIPFGKYKGQPVEVLLSDKSYLEWCQSQPEMVRRYASLFESLRNLLKSAQDCTPEHNKLQARFLTDKAFVRDFVFAVTGFNLKEENEKKMAMPLFDGRIEGVTKFIDHQRQPESFCFKMEQIKFEVAVGGVYVDVLIPFSIIKEEVKVGEQFQKYQDYKKTHKHEPTYPDWYKYEWENEKTFDVKDYQIVVELKPTIGDEYPKILRTILSLTDEGYCPAWITRFFCVYTDGYEGSIPVEQVKQIFSSRGVYFLTREDIIPQPSS